MIITTLAIATIGALAGRSAAKTADHLLSMAESVERRTQHTIYSFTFICKNQDEYRTYRYAIATVQEIAGSVITEMGWPQEDIHVVSKAILEGVLMWGKFGYDIRASLLGMLPPDEDMRYAAAKSVGDQIDRLSPARRQRLLALATLLA